MLIIVSYFVFERVLLYARFEEKDTLKGNIPPIWSFVVFL